MEGVMEDSTLRPYCISKFKEYYNTNKSILDFSDFNKIIGDRTYPLRRIKSI